MGQMTFEEFQEISAETAIYSKQWSMMYPALGLAGEAGEVCNKVKKIFRDEGGYLADEVREALAKELGDVLWYISALATDLDLNLDDIARGNRDKLESRHKRALLAAAGTIDEQELLLSFRLRRIYLQEPVCPVEW